MTATAEGRVRDAVRALRGSVEKYGWHGPAALEAVDGVGDEQGARRVPGAHHTVAELVAHIAYWEAMVLHHASKGAAPRPGEDWASGAALSDVVAQLRTTHTALIECVRRLKDADLERMIPVEGGEMRLADVLHGLAAHTTYHTGQIRLLLTLIDG